MTTIASSTGCNLNRIATAICSRTVKGNRACSVSASDIPMSLRHQVGLTALTTAASVDRPFRLIPPILETFSNLTKRITEEKNKSEKSVLDKHCCAGAFQGMESKIGNFKKLVRANYLLPKIYHYKVFCSQYRNLIRWLISRTPEIL